MSGQSVSARPKIEEILSISGTFTVCVSCIPFSNKIVNDIFKKIQNSIIYYYFFFNQQPNLTHTPNKYTREFLLPSYTKEPNYQSDTSAKWLLTTTTTIYYIYLLIISEIERKIGHCSCDSAKSIRRF